LASSTNRRESPPPTPGAWVSELNAPRESLPGGHAGKAEWQDFEWDTEDATKTDIVAKPLRLLDETLRGQDALRRYTVCREVPYGGLPDVHLALLEGAAGFRRTVAVQRLRREPGAEAHVPPGLSPDALLGCHVRHPNVIPVLDLIEVQGEFLLVMEYVISETFTQLRSRGNRPPIPISVAIASGILHALDAAHTAKDAFGSPLEIVHAGLAPDTVLIGVDGIARLIHFGLAKKSQPPAPGRAHLKGRPGYFAPEQVFDRRVDARTDVFAAGILLWESLAGRPLLEGDGPVDSMMRFLGRGTRPPSEVNPQVSGELDAVLARALEPAPERRFQSAAEFAEALEAAVEPATRAEVSRYVEGLAWVSIREQRALLNDTRTDDDGVQRSRAPRTPSAPEILALAQIPEDLDDPTLIPGSLPYLAQSSDAVSHWASRRPDEATAVEMRVLATEAPPPSLADAASEYDDQVESAPPPPFKQATPFPAAIASAPVASRAPVSLSEASAPPRRKLKFWLSCALVATFGTAAAWGVLANRARVGEVLSQSSQRPAPTPKATALAAAARSVSAEAPRLPTPAPSARDADSARVLRVDELPLLSASAQPEPAIKAPAPRRRPIRYRRKPAPVASAAPVETPPAPTREEEPPLRLDP
jgi:serine/threonine-protein kinase